MRHRIGLYLSAKPLDGGVYQYNLSTLEAMGSLSTEKYSTVVAYTSNMWEKHLSALDVKRLFVPPSVWTRALGRLARERLLPVPTLRSLSMTVHPVMKRLHKEFCDLWIFPSQDPMSYFGEIPSLVAIHDLMHRYEKRFPEVSANGQFEWREQHYSNMCRFARGILVDSNVGKQHVCESYGIDQEKIHVLPFIAPAYATSPKVCEGFETRYKLPRRFLFYPAQFWEHKNHKNLIKAIYHLRHELPDIHLVLIGGEKNAFESVRELVAELSLKERVHFLGYVPDEDSVEFYRRAVAMIMPTFFGPTNIPPLEAFELGCPTAVSDIYGMREQVQDAGLFFDPHSIESISLTIRKIWVDEHLRQELVARGRARAASWNKGFFKERLAQIIEKALAQGEEKS